MLVRGLRRVVPFVGPLLILAIFAWKFYDGRTIDLPFLNDLWKGKSSTTDVDDQQQNPPKETLPTTPSSYDLSEQHETHREVFSVSTADQKYFSIKFGNEEALNPNIIPHPALNDTWIIVAQLQRGPVKHSIWFAELVCNAVFRNDALECVKAPIILPIAATPGGRCEGDLAYFALNLGPHDARVFYGPRMPFAMYGSNSAYTCFGQWIQDFRVLVDWGFEMFSEKEFRMATELQRPAPYGPIEKNWFVFWDKDEQIYAHYDIAPKRVFAKLGHDGSVGPDLAPLAADGDRKCMAKYMPQIAPEQESIHQATNSLSVTLCERLDLSCEASDSNTFILTMFQHKKYYQFHGVYEPYVILFQRTAPFAIHAISQKPIWIHGRGKAEPPDSLSGENRESWNQTEMFYITSLSWKKQGQRYHAHMDDVLFLAFGVEDSGTAGIDIVAGDLLRDLGLCSTL